MTAFFDQDDIDDLQEDFDQMVEINGQSCRAIIRQKEHVSDGMGGFIVTDPVAKLASSVVSALSIEGGEEGSTLVDGDTCYRVLSVIDGGDGVASLRLEAL